MEQLVNVVFFYRDDPGCSMEDANSFSEFKRATGIFREPVHGNVEIRFVALNLINARLLKDYVPGLLEFVLFNKTLVFG